MKYQITSKILKNVKLLNYKRTIESEENKLDKHLFEGLAQLESLILSASESSLLSFDIFEPLVNLTELILYDVPTPNGIFDNLNQLRKLEKYSINNKLQLVYLRTREILLNSH